MRRLLLSLVVSLALLLPLSALAVDVGQGLIPFAGTSLQGEKIDLDQYIGKNPIMLIFWASWCPNCQREVPKVNALLKEYGPRGMKFIAINVGMNDSVERARAFMKKHGMNYPVLFDQKSVLSRKYGVQGVPTVVVADKQGRVIFRNFGVPEISEENFQKMTR